MNEIDWDDRASERSVASSLESLDDLIESKHVIPSHSVGDDIAGNEDVEQREFKELTMAKKWEKVMQLLISKDQAWAKESQDFGSEDGTALKPYLKKGLLWRDTREPSEPTMLHLLAKDFNSGRFTTLDDSTQLEIFTYLVDNLVTETAQDAGENAGETPVLSLAMRWQNEDFLQYIAKNFKNRLALLIETKDKDGMNCLHYAFQALLMKLVSDDRKSNNKQTPTNNTPTSVNIEETLKILDSFIKAATPESIAAQDSKGNTPIHHAVHYWLCRYLPSRYRQYSGIVEQLVDKGDALLNTTHKENQFNSDGMSPYKYHLETKKTLLERAKQRGPAASSVAQTGTKSRLPDSQESKILKARKIGERGKEDKLAPEQDSKDLIDKRHADKTLADGRTGIDSGRKDKDENATTADTMLSHASGHRATRSSTIRRDNAGAVHTVSVVADNEPLMPTSGENASNTTSDSRLRSRAAQSRDNTRLKAPQATPQGSKRENAGVTVSEGSILGWLKLHYIRTRPDMEAKELLYGKIASDKNLFFDATHLSGKSVKDVAHLSGKSAKDIANLVLWLSSPGGFESTLSYIALPVISLDAASEISSKSGQHAANQGQKRDQKGEDVQLGRSSLITVFETLFGVGVRHVLQLHVDDMEAPSHSDAAIEKCLVGEDSMSSNAVGKGNRRIHVELWNWKKPDMSVDVIKFAAPDVVQINLYWTGNHAVLRGWASPEGIPSLYAAKKRLRKVLLYVSPGIETLKRTGQLVNDFVTKIEERTNKEVQIGRRQWQPSTTAGSAAEAQLSFGAGLPLDEPRHDWISVMEKFRRAMFSIHGFLPEGAKPQRVKVALIDDGVDRTTLVPYRDGRTGKDRVEVTGLSYWTSKDRNLLGWPWHQSTHGHGTIMANMIARVNPWVSLMVMRIQDEGDRSSPTAGSIRIHAKSAAKAIEDAIIRKADIISMSWTIKTMVAPNSGNRKEDASVTALRAALNKATDKGILMFCSASDNLQQSSADSLPFSQNTKYIFRVGAAGLTGQRDGATEEHETISWFLPGRKVAEDFNPREARILQYHDGSSVATALAAGLASLVIYISVVMQELNTGNAETFGNYANLLRERDNMNKAFCNITNDYYDRKYLPVWYTFGECADVILAKDVPQEKKLQRFEDLVRSLCVNLKSTRLQ